MKTRKFSAQIVDLSKNEYLTVNGGESGWYWVAYAIGQAAREAKDFALGVYVFVQSSRPIGFA